MREQVKAHRGGSPGAPDATRVSWAIVGIGTVANIGRELGLLSPRARKQLVREVGRALIGEAP